MAKKFMEKMKEGVSVQEMEDFARKYTMEVFSALAIAFAAISGALTFFFGPGITIFAATVGVILGVFYPAPVEKILKQFYQFVYKQEKTVQLLVGCVQVIIGIFLPFAVFAAVGLLAGTSYHFYTRGAQHTSERSQKPRRPSNEDLD